MEVADVVQWWEDWQLRILVLGSLFLQCFLFATAALRKRRVPAWLRVCIWLAYLGSDAVAVYALATLFNHQRKRQWMHTTGKNTALQVLWAPVLLLHLGGQDSISAFSIEDNELWKRHVLTAASQITVAIYVFCKSLPEDIRVFQATILIFVPGILKCLEKPWALNKASIYSMSVSASCYRTINKAQDREGSNNYSSLDDYVKNAVEYFNKGGEEPASAGGHHREECVLKRPYKLFVDLSYSYGDRLENLKYMSQRRRDELRQDLHTRLLETFDRFYTKRQVYSDTLRGRVVRIVAVILTFAATVLFHTRSEEEAYADTDVIITYVLLCCTVSMEFISSTSGWLIKRTTTAGGGPLLLPWSEQVEVAQYNLIWYLTCRNNRQGLLLRWLAKLVRCKDRLDRLSCMDPCNDDGITELVHGHITRGWKSAITDAKTYRDFNDNRGQLALKSSTSQKLERSLRRPFDESVLLWHLATDFCFYNATSHPSMEDEATATRCRRMSNYMVYLLFVQPEMLIPGARYGLFKAAYHELRFGIMDGQALPLGVGEKELAETIMRQMEEKTKHLCTRDDGPRLVHEAWALAQELASVRKKKGEKTMWRLIQGVWVEMLCFSAGRTRGYLHAKVLGNGGEYLSYVWLLLWYMGMETFAVRLQRTGLQEEGDMSAPVLDPQTSASLPKPDSITRRSPPAATGDDAV